ncbi:MAG TPA: deoxyguanosinetriphosphate triphosphohydrolase [Ruminococcus sp.]|nr:deoxyguanosinetriphosphate triphosphohydrolase [Ruminococcus sp.]
MKLSWNKLLCEERAYMPQDRPGSSNNQDPRNEFQKDYHRIIGSASFRRLQDKTQVFPLDRGDFVRTRLTHSLEVASFARSLGQMICIHIMENGLDPEMDTDKTDKICTVLECSGLIHDIGNPPFGHFGEDYIRYWFSNKLSGYYYKKDAVTDLLTEQMKGDLYNFEGNAQALRILTRLHYLIGNNGMNLTFGLLNTIIKYPAASTEIKKSKSIIHKKMGYYAAEEDIFRRITEATGAVDCRHPLAYILEAADDIAYKTADIEDAVKKGLISYRDILEALKASQDKAANFGEHDKYIETIESLERRHEKASSDYEAVSQWLITRVQSLLLRSARYGFTSNYKAIMNGEYPHDILYGTQGQTLADVLGDLAVKHVFRSKDIYKLEISAETILGFLMDKLVKAAVNYDPEAGGKISVDERIMSLVSENYRKAYADGAKGKSEAEKLYLRLLLVTDYICGMTDGYAKKLYQEFSGII